MKILFVITRAGTIGGAQIHVRDLATALKTLHHDPIVAAGGRGKFSEQLGELEIPFYEQRYLVRDISPINDMRAIWNIRKLIQSHEPDLVSAHSSKAGVIARLAAIATGVPVIFTAHGWAFTEGVTAIKSLLYRTIERLLAPLSAKIITVSEHSRELAIHYRVANAQKLIAIHNGMPEGVSNPPVFVTQHDCVRLIMVARFEEQKDHELLIRALAHLNTKSNWKLKLVGTGPLESKFQSLVLSLGLADRISFLGERNDVADLLRQSDIFLLISHWEGFPRSILEAMREGLPVIASNVGGVSESVAHNETGLLVKASNEEDLRKGLQKLIDNPALRRRFGTAGSKRFLLEFTFARMFEKTMAVYQHILRK